MSVFPGEPPPPYCIVEEDLTPHCGDVLDNPARNTSPRRRVTSTHEASLNPGERDSCQPHASSASLGAPSAAPLYPVILSSLEGPADCITLPVKPASSEDDIHIPIVPSVPTVNTVPTFPLSADI